MNATAKHTPGPWRADTNGSVRVQCYPDGLRVGVLSLQLPQQEREANARLIAAAPDMLVAIRHTINGLEAEFGPARARQNFPDLYAAVAKAEGR